MLHLDNGIAEVVPYRQQPRHAERLQWPANDDNDDSLAVALRMESGALVNILYVTNGNPSLGKERIEAHAGGGSLVIDDWKSIRFHGLRGKDAGSSAEDKGQAALMENFIAAIRGEAPLMVTAEDGRWATRIALEAMAAAQGTA